jgi:molecular chaperone GrpE
MPIKKTDITKQKLAEMEQNWKRALADYQNLVKRTQEQQNMMRNFACISLVERLLPALDHLELAATHLNDPGLNMVVSQFKQAFDDEGVKPIKALGEIFDPQVMECVELVEGEDNVVMEVVTQGYLLQTKIIRAAKVKVGKKEA